MGTGAAAASLGACAPMPTGAGRYERPYSRKPWVAPRIDRENVIREVVGHRPYRPGGFVVRSEKQGDKVVVHNYGHGGAGITLSWGSSALAVRETLGMTHRDVAIIGSGVMGLTSARLLQDAGWNITIYTKDMARHTTSNVAGGEWGPFSAHDPAVSSDAFKSQLAFAARISHHAHTNLGGPDYGIRWTELYRPTDEVEDDTDGERFPELYPYEGLMGPGEHPFPTRYCQVSVTMMVEPAVFLRRLTEDVHQAGGKFVIRNFADREELQTLPEPVIFNCTGLGARALFGDEELTPAKGQLVYLPPDPDVDYLTIGGGNGNLYMFSRSDVLLLGGTFKLGDWSTNPEPAETERILREHQRLFARF
ncbi:MAG: FAD-binding oxidoreductase [Gammaproteobacteria bacterium]|nr:FAD-binding oxidoreductase [Gammaproteobacteria bacterium]